ncbi:MAG: hypothetical protein IKM07_07775, partial [Clostridia bacterium]|nr:hypothetical protein [Clostridia bacterium]
VLGKYLRALHVSDNFSHGLHWHSFPYSGIVNFDSIIYALIDMGYEGYFNFEAPYIVRPAYCCPLIRNDWKHPTRNEYQNLLTDPPLKLVMMAEELLYETGRHMLEQYGIFEE